MIWALLKKPIKVKHGTIVACAWTTKHADGQVYRVRRCGGEDSTSYIIEYGVDHTVFGEHGCVWPSLEVTKQLLNWMIP